MDLRKPPLSHNCTGINILSVETDELQPTVLIGWLKNGPENYDDLDDEDRYILLSPAASRELARQIVEAADAVERGERYVQLNRPH
ncbi:hypothetical protein BYZ73_04035 [Rhodovulum viride]|uniref:Uncharacterized protein n=1 Tax=Rhodovulum viride TaxID=1231134 RepID=A0ABX9DMN6_9RHOB|nr:hypothetical protein [Rhodovulum viride]RAP42836.1 hypothetical protein BYZ73_04035 [Rhodovulum viride]